MITAHLPSGYVLARLRGWNGAIFAAALAGAVFPDIDLLAFYLIDDRAVHHHRYWVHAPAFALICSALLIALVPARLRPPAIAFGAAWLMHICLDTIVGEIMWLWPFSNAGYSLFTVPGVEGQHFLLTILAHWTIGFELLVWLAALICWRVAARS